MNEIFEKNFATYCNTKYALGVANGLDALSLIIKAYDFKKDDEIIVPSNIQGLAGLATSLVEVAKEK